MTEQELKDQMQSAASQWYHASGNGSVVGYMLPIVQEYTASKDAEIAELKATFDWMAGCVDKHKEEIKRLREGLSGYLSFIHIVTQETDDYNEKQELGKLYKHVQSLLTPSNEESKETTAIEPPTLKIYNDGKGKRQSFEASLVAPDYHEIDGYGATAEEAIENLRRDVALRIKRLQSIDWSRQNNSK